jgi:hypothetical protein
MLEPEPAVVFSGRKQRSSEQENPDRRPADGLQRAEVVADVGNHCDRTPEWVKPLEPRRT